MDALEWLTKEDYARAKANGISYNTAYCRYYYYGYDKERALTEPPYHPDMWKRYKELAYEHGICESTFRNRVNKMKMDPEKAATTPLMGINAKGRPPKLTEEQEAIANKNGISRKTVLARMQQYHWSLEKAISVPVGSHKKKQPFGMEKRRNEANCVRS